MKTNWDKKEVVEALENNAFYNKDYKNGFLFRESDNTVLEHIKENFIKDKVLLDFACGTGRLVNVLKANGIELTKNNYLGFDYTPAMVEKAKEKFPELNFTSNIKDIENNKNIYMLVNIDMLQHSESLEEIKNNIEKLSKIANKSVFHLWYKNNDEYKPIELQGNIFHEYFPSPESLTDILPNKDFHIDLKLHKCNASEKFDRSFYKCAVIKLEKKTITVLNELLEETNNLKKEQDKTKN